MACAKEHHIKSVLNTFTQYYSWCDDVEVGLFMLSTLLNNVS